ncbi:hypothetical protein ABW19_dt0200964 [Dactylella cylindrospora]|nr:hypothetical protein ABW19_dt0200964 [Dactylella cylindrospora]
MKDMNEEAEYGHRTVALKVTELGKEKGVRTYIVVPPTIYGTTPALIPRMSVQLPPLIRTAITTSKSHHINSGLAVWSNVHITDLANLYDLIIRSALSGAAPSGNDGIYFASNGEKTWKEIAEGIKDAVEGLEGWGGNVEVESWGVEDAAGIEGVNGPRDAMLAFGSNVITIPDKSLALGWKPVFGGDALLESIKKDAALIWEDIKKGR